MAATSLETIQSTIHRNSDVLRRRYGVRSLGVFGSYVHGKQTEHSDVDILVDLNDDVGFFQFLDLEEYLSQILAVKVDLATPGALKPYIGQRIRSEVKTIL